MKKISSEKLSPVIIFSFIIGVSVIILLFMGFGMDKGNHTNNMHNGSTNTNDEMHQTDDIENKEIDTLKAGEEVDTTVEPIVDGHKKFKKDEE